jgi:hypothetical protein
MLLSHIRLAVGAATGMVIGILVPPPFPGVGFCVPPRAPPASIRSRGWLIYVVAEEVECVRCAMVDLGQMHGHVVLRLFDCKIVGEGRLREHVAWQWVGDWYLAGAEYAVDHASHESEAHFTR